MTPVLDHLIVEVLREKSDIRQTEIAEHIYSDASSVREALRRLERKGVVRTTRVGCKNTYEVLPCDHVCGKCGAR